VFGLLSVLGLLVPTLPRPVGLLSPVGLVDRLEPRARIGPLRLLRGLLIPVGLLRTDGLRSDVAPDDTVGFVGLVNVGVGVGVRGLPTDDAPVDSDEGDETDEPVDETGAQLTPGVIVGDGLDVVVDLVALVPVVELGPVVPVPVPPVVCANAGAVLKAIAHMRPAPLRIGIFRILVKMFPPSMSPAIDLPSHRRSMQAFT
jgi:hypothetical protein